MRQGVGVLQERLEETEDRLKELKVQKGELEQEQMRLTVAIEKDEVGQQIHEIERKSIRE